MNLLEIRGPHVFGDWTVTQLVEWEGEAFPHSFLFPNIPLSVLHQASPLGAHRRLTETGMVITTNQIFVLRQNDLVVLIELGTGNDKVRPAEPYWNNQHLPYLETLAALNIQPEAVAYALISHLHPDHVGLATTRSADRWVPTFPNAKYVLHEDEWNYWSHIPAGDPRWHPCLEDSVLPLVEAGCIQWVRDSECVAGIRIHQAGGHTPGHTLFEIEGSKLWFVGDLLHHPAQVKHPDWPSAPFDIDQEMNIRQRQHYFQRLADSGAILFAEHVGDAFRIIETAPGRFFARYE